MFSRLLLIAAATLPGATAPPAPPPPDVYNVQVRYQINAFRNEHVRQYFEMLDYFKKAGFVRDLEDVAPDDEAENSQYDRMRGTIPSDKARLLLSERHVRVLQLLPKGQKLPAAAGAPVRVDMELASGFAPERQRQLAVQTERVLQGLGFKEAVAYDTRGRTRLLGSVPVEKLNDLLGDLRLQPVAWSLLSGSPLNDLRRETGGADQLEALLLAWYDMPKGKELLLPILDEWQHRPAGAEFVQRQPAALFTKIDEQTKMPDLTLLHERLLAHMAHNADSADLLDKLLTAVVASPDGPALIAPLLGRMQASGVEKTLPVFFRTAAPVVVTEVLPELPVPSVHPPTPAVPKGQEKVSPELRDLLGDAAKSAAPTRMEVILARTPADDDSAATSFLKAAAPGLVVEGRLGPLISVRSAAAQATVLAALPDVAGVRLARAARPRLETAEAVEGWDPLRASGVARLHAMDRKGRGTRVAVIDGDFSGWRGLVGKQLPDDTRMVDLTRERNDDLEPDPDPGEVGAGQPRPYGHGAHMALAVLRAAPDVELVLVRIDPAAPYMLQEAARAMNGETIASDGLRNRLAKLQADRFVLDQELPPLLDQRRLLLKKFIDTTQKDLLIKKKEKGVLSLDEETQLNDILSMEEYEKKQAAWDRRDREYRDQVDRYFKLVKDLQNLKNVRVAASGLVWNEGHPADTTGALTRYFDDRPFGATLWFQSAGDARGQAWSGLFRDEDGDGVMEFDSAAASPHDGPWARQLDFLSWAPDTGKPTLDLPAGARARVSVQWREAHDPDAGRPGEDPYVKPLADLRIVVLYQPDPTGAKQPADDLDVVVQSVGQPLRLSATPSSAVYEQTVELQVTKPGRYAVRIEGAAPTSTRSREDPTIPAARKTFELHPRLFVETLEGPGRVLLHDYVTEAGTLGMPADSRSLITVGAADSHGLPQPYSTGGPPHDVLLLAKPDVLAYDQVEEGKDAAQGTGVATGFAAGLAALTRGTTPARTAGWREGMGVESGGVLRVPK